MRLAAAKRAREREKLRMVDSGVLKEGYFEKNVQGGSKAWSKKRVVKGDFEEDEEDALMRENHDEDVALEEEKKKKKKKKQKKGNEEEEEEEEIPDAHKLDMSEVQEEDYDDEDELLRLQKEDRSNIKLDAFNLKAEREAGTFDASGNYVWTRKDLADGEEDDDDPWLSSLKDSKDLTGKELALKDAMRKSKSSARQKNLESHSEKFHTQRLIDHLLDGETVLKALQRLGKTDKEKLGIITESATNLLGSMPEIYDCTERVLDAAVSEEREILMEKTFWQYKTSEEPGAEIHGPFTASMMEAWRQAGYFDNTKQRILFRRYFDRNQTTEEPPQKLRKVDVGRTALEADFDNDDEDEEKQAKNSTTTEKATTEWMPLSKVSFAQVFS